MNDVHLLRIRGLRTNFYTYQGVVKALDGIDLDMMKGETIGLVGETGCGKSVTALSMLRLIPSPPGRVEGGEALFDVGEEQLARIEELKDQVHDDLRFLFGVQSHFYTSAISASLLAEASEAVQRAPSVKEAKRTEILPRFKELRDLLLKFDLLSKSPEGLREIRGHQISMIFQEPMQALNPVFTVGDQISESIILHRRRWVARRVTLRMREEVLRGAVIRALHEVFHDRRQLPPGIDLDKPARSDLLQVLEVLEKDPERHKALIAQLGELVRLKSILGIEHSESTVFARAFPKGLQFRIYKRECLRSGWSSSAVLEELELLMSLHGMEGETLWSDTKTLSDGGLVLLPAGGSTPEELLKHLATVVKANTSSEFSWSALGDILEPPKIDKGGVVLRVRKDYVRASKAISDRIIARLPLIRNPLLHPMRVQAQDEAARILSLLKIPDPQRVVKSYPHELSGGMNQRALIAIALSCDPLLLIADEPTTALDVTIQAQILELLKTLKESGRPSILIITHDLGVIADICDRVCVMYGGVVVEDAPVREIFKDPKHPYTKGLLRAIPSHAQKKETLDTIPGSVPNLIYPPGGCRFHPRCPVAMPTCGWDAKDLEDNLKAEAERLRIDEAITVYERTAPTKLEVSFAQDPNGEAALKAIRAYADAHRADMPLFQAVQQVQVKGNVLAFTLLEPKKPDPVETSAGHRVACLLYEGGPEVA